MMPVLVDLSKATRYILLSNIILLLFSTLFIFTNSAGAIFAVFSLFMGGFLLYANIRLVKKPDISKAWLSFKASSPYLALIMGAMIADMYIPI